MFRIRYAVVALFGVALVGVAGAQDRKFDLKFKNEKGELVPFYQKMKTEVAQHIKVQGQDLPQRQMSTFYYQWTPLKEEKVKEGNEEITKWTLKQKIEGLEIDIDISGNPIKYSSKTPDTSGAAGNPGLVDFFKNLKDAEFTVTLGKGYKVEKVDGGKEFINKLGAGNAQMDALLKKVMTDDALKDMTDPTYKLLPETPKKKGDEWSRNTKLNLGPIGSYDLTYKFKFVDPDKDGERKDFDKIEVETIINYSPPPPPKDGVKDEVLLFRIKDTGSNLHSDPAGSKGFFYYDSKNQRIPYANIKIKLKGELTVVIGGTDTKVELTQEQETTIETGDVSYYAPPAKTPTTPPSAPPSTPPTEPKKQ